MKQVIIIFAAILLISACRTKDRETDKAGKGGSATITVYPQHHENAKRLINCKVYVKYGTKDAPTSGIYDDSVAGTNHDSLVSAAFVGLKNGDYYFYGTAYDTSVKQDLHGGAPYTITQQTAQNLNLAVSE